MKTIAISCAAALIAATSAVAGPQTVSGKTSKEYKAPAPIPCFKDHELQLDLFASYTAFDDGSNYDDGFGGGLALNYFFTRYLGLGADGNFLDADVSGLWDATGRVIARYPIEGSVCVAPYAFIGGGVQANGTTIGTAHAGGGLEWRATQSFGVFGEGRYTWGATDHDASQARLGFRFVF